MARIKNRAIREDRIFTLCGDLNNVPNSHNPPYPSNNKGKERKENTNDNSGINNNM